jgi:hypothetical protein
VKVPRVLDFLVMNFCSQLPEPHVIMYVSSLQVLACDCAFVHMTTSNAQPEKKNLCYSTMSVGMS